MGKRTFGSIRKLPPKRWQARYVGPGGEAYTGPGTTDDEPREEYEKRRDETGEAGDQRPV